MKKLHIPALALLLLAANPSYSQQIVEGSCCFAWMSDLHVSPGTPSENDLRSCIADINSLEGRLRPEFVIVSGDLTNFGTDAQIYKVKEMLDSLQMPHFSIPGNHDAKWSESGCNTFGKVFDGENFSFEAAGFRFVGCASGPDMRMTPALIPRQHIEWLSEMSERQAPKPSIFVNHYPLDSSVLNYGEVWQLMRTLDTRVALGGHWHNNLELDYAGIPGILCRSTLSTKKDPAGYNLVRIDDGIMKIYERRPGSTESVLWCEKDLNVVEPAELVLDHGLTDDYPWMRHDVNLQYPQLRELWRIQENANIAAGFAEDGHGRAFYATETGLLKCVNIEDGSMIWERQLPGKAFSTPTYSRGLVMIGCAEGGMYAFESRTGRLKWVHPTEKSVLASPVVLGRRLFFGASDGIFRAVNLRNGRLIWAFDGVSAFVECRPYADRTQIVFGAWDRCLYSLDPRDGSLQWKWEVEKKSEMYSPAACWPVKAKGRIFVAVPDRKVYALDAASGAQLGVADGGREAIGLSRDGRTVFAKSMFHKIYALDAEASADSLGLLPKIWEVESGLGYDIAPTPLVHYGDLLIVPTDKGNIVAYDVLDGSMAWAHKLSPALVNPVLPIEGRSAKKTGSSGNLLLASTLDGVVTLLEF